MFRRPKRTCQGQLVTETRSPFTNQRAKVFKKLVKENLLVCIRLMRSLRKLVNRTCTSKTVNAVKANSSLKLDHPLHITSKFFRETCERKTAPLQTIVCGVGLFSATKHYGYFFDYSSRHLGLGEHRRVGQK